MLQIHSAWGCGVAQHSTTQPPWLSPRTPISQSCQAVLSGHTGCRRAQGMSRIQGFQQRGEICGLAGQRISDTKEKGKIQQHKREWVERGRRARSVQKGVWR